MASIPFDQYMRVSQTAFQRFDNSLTIISYCSICTTLLYQNEYYWRFSRLLGDFPCSTWGLLTIMNAAGQILVCDKHMENDSFDERGILIFPGPAMNLDNFNFKEKPSLSPIKIMTRMTRGISSDNSFVGHYQLSGSIWTTLNQDFAIRLPAYFN